TGLSSHELNMPGTYKEVTDFSIVAMFKVRRNDNAAFLFDSADEDVRILAWTTTPWTLPSNVALTVGPDIQYVKVKTYNPYTGAPVSVVLAKDRLTAYFPAEHAELPYEGYEFKPNDKKVPYRVGNATFAGKQLVGLRFEQLLPYVTSPELEADGFRVISGAWVTTEDGTGVVHTAPYFGADDFRACRENGVPMIGVKDDKGVIQPLVDRQGRFVPEVTDFAGRYVKAEYYSKDVQEDKEFKPTDLLIALKLKDEGKAFRIEKYKHPYPHCWRTDKPVLYYPLDSWFVRASAAKERMAELNRSINWKPASTGTGRFGQWLDNLQDWNLSRSRYWGIPLPIWRTEDGEEELCIGSVDELNAAIERSIEAGLMSRNPYASLNNDEEEANAIGHFVFTGDKQFWDILKQYGRDNRKAPTEAEDTLWQAIRNRKLDGLKFRRQHAIGSFIADFVCISEKLVIEVDGEYHSSEDQKRFDEARTAFLNEAGFRVIRFTNEEVMNNLSGVLVTLRRALASPPGPLSKGEGEAIASVGASPSPLERGPGGEAADLHRPYIDDVV
ncbi:MAG TPA: class I tRNA ligase family protein, partial [Saprospiraceae bacterium]|nr:class I tRNA ligase family protein [Saprospiraceae bacterium]